MDRLRDAILSCQLMPGQTVSEQELCERFQLGRAGIRNALAQLSAKRLVEGLARRGWRISPITPRQIRDLCAARRRLEPAMLEGGRSAAETLRLAHLASVIETLRGQSDPAAILTARRYDRELLGALAAGGNVWAHRWMDEAWDWSARVVAFLERTSASRFTVFSRAALVEALQRGDAVAAAREIDASIAHFETFATDALLSLPISLAADDERRRKRSETMYKRRSSATGTKPLIDQNGEIE
ncbi:GntR family transcriptional regulator [Jiella mangrovi]|uniref:GntR family transcriptional regulator n=1 Tax=Jiella mangrovi TaxID=2821407 RepID=A0ABS4BLB6_9HYPH|nr:GntR family transcriptional regulator [Jiella mangrovi]